MQPPHVEVSATGATTVNGQPSASASVPQPNIPTVTGVQTPAISPTSSVTTNLDNLNYNDLGKKYGINYTGTPAQKMAIQATYLGFQGKTLPGISGGSAIGLGNQTNTAMTAGLSAITSPQTGSPTPTNQPTTVYSTPQNPLPAGVLSQTTNPDGTINYTLTDGTVHTTTIDPTVTAAKNQITTQTADQLSSLDQQYQSQLADLTKKLNDATKGAEASYDTNNPEGSGSDKSVYITAVGAPIQKAIDDLNNSYNSGRKSIQDTSSTQIANIDAQVKSNAMNTFNTLLSSLPGDSMLSSTDYSTLMGAAIQSGQSPTLADMQIKNAQQNAIIKYDKTLSAQEKTDASQGLALLKDSLANTGTDFGNLNPNNPADTATIKTYQDMAINARVGVPNGMTTESAIANGKINYDEVNAFLASQSKGALQQRQMQLNAQKTQDDIAKTNQAIILAQQKAAIAATKFTSEQALTYVKGLSPDLITTLKSQLTSSDPSIAIKGTDWITSRASSRDADPTVLAQAIEDQYGIPATKVLTDVTTKSGIFGTSIGASTSTSTKTTTTEGGSKTDITAPSYNVDGVIYTQGSDGNYYPKSQ